jgi:hypothetical protein
MAAQLHCTVPTAPHGPTAGYPYMAAQLHVDEEWIAALVDGTVTIEFLESLESSGLGTAEIGDKLLWKISEAPGCPLLLDAPWLCPWRARGPWGQHPCCWKVYRKEKPKKTHSMKLRSHGPYWTQWTGVFSY